jgi:SNF2 family DNA or RNA helicase
VATAELTEDGTQILMSTSYQDRHLMAQLAGARYSRGDDGWYVYLGWSSCVALRGLFGKDLVIGERLQAWAWKERNERVLPAMKLRSLLAPENRDTAIQRHLDEIEAELSYKLYDYQRVDAEFMALTKSALLANEPGLGKTGVAIRTLQLLDRMGLDPYPAIVVCTTSLKFTVWDEAFREWEAGLRVNVIDGSAGKRRKQLLEPADVYIINYDALRLHSKLAPYGGMSMTEAEKLPKELNELGHRTVIFDEAHRIKDAKSKQTRAAWAIAHAAAHRYTLTGTPVAKDIGDLWALLHAVDPYQFPAKTKFMERYASMSFNPFGGSTVTGINPATSAELFSVIDPMMRRIPKKLALPQLPPKLPTQYRHTPMSPKQRVAYKQMRDAMMAELNELLIAPNPLSKLTRLLQFASSMAEVETVMVKKRAENDQGEMIEWEEEVERVKLINPSTKVDDLIELLDEMGDAPLVVAAVSRQLIELAAKKLDEKKISYGLVTGAQSGIERQLAVKRFQAGQDRVILLTLGAGAEGITLTRADTMLFMQRSWSEIQNQQAEERIYRPGSEQHDCITIIEQITPDTVEESKRDLLAGKQMRMEEIVRDKAMLIRLLGAK